MRLILIVFVLVASSANIFAQADIENSKDYPILNRLDNFSITKYEESEFDKHSFYYESKTHIHEGRKFLIEYKHNNYADKEYEFPTRLQILRNYSNAIKKAGGRVLFERYNSEHGFYSFETLGKKTVWIQVKVLSGKYYKLIIIEEEKMRQDLEINVDLIKNKLEVEGKISIHSIYFDTGKSIIKVESDPAIKQIAEFLKMNPSINCWVVGHTDSEGSFEINSKLSLDRAKAVKQELESKYGIPQHRLFAEGVGPLAPLGSNNTEEGRSLNRRVELVKK